MLSQSLVLRYVESKRLGWRREDQAEWKRRVGAQWTPWPCAGVPVSLPGAGERSDSDLCVLAGHSDSEVAVMIGAAAWVG
jgi:hypothetical protein